MKCRVPYTICLLLSMAYTAPIRESASQVIYTAEYDVVNIIFPVNRLNGITPNFTSVEKEASFKPLIFFVLADTEGKQMTYKGLYIRKRGVVTKLLDNGIDATAANDNSNTAYFAATDGIYSYNDKENRAEKYGTITDNIIGITKLNNSDTLYILTEDHMVWKVSEGGTKMNKIPEIDNAQQIVMDYMNNLYFISNHNVYVYSQNGVKKIEGLPESSGHVRLYRAPFDITDGVGVVADNKPYIAYANGAAKLQDVILKPEVTVYSAEGLVIVYQAYNKKIYEFNLITSLINVLFKAMKNA